MAAYTFRTFRYGVPADLVYKPIVDAGSSGLSPLPPLNPSILLSPNEKAHRELVEKYQHSVIRGFTTRQLEDLDCITERELNPNNLENPIFEPWQRQHWDGKAGIRNSFKLYPINEEVKDFIGKEGQDLEWTVDHDFIWAVLEPALRLGTRILEGMVDHPWLDALLLGYREDIPSQRFPSSALNTKTLDELQEQHTIFRSRSFEERNFGIDCRKQFKELVKDVFDLRLSFGISDDKFDPETGQDTKYGRVRAQTLMMDHIMDVPDIKIWLTWNSIASLLNPDINSSERLMETWHLATLMVHETIHALNHAQCMFVGRDEFQWDENLQTEPYFELEPVSELGHSSETALYGGVILPLAVKNPVISHPRLAYAIRAAKPSNDRFGKPPILINPGPPKDNFLIPLPVTYYENLNSEEYWELFVRKFGINGALKPPKVVDGLWAQDIPGKGQTWYAIDDAEKTARQMLDKFSIQSLTAMDSDQRVQHALVMKREMVAAFQPMMRHRDEIVTELLPSAEQLMLIDRGHADYPYRLQELGKEIDELLQCHSNLCDRLTKVEAYSGTVVTSARQNITYFHRKFVQFVDHFVQDHDAAALAQAGFQDFQADLAVFTISLNANGPPLTDLGERQILDAYRAYRQGQYYPAGTLCTSAMASLECLSYTRILAYFLMASLSGNTLMRLYCLRLAMKAYQPLDKAQTPVQFQEPLQHFDGDSVQLLANLEAMEKLEAAMIDCG